MAKEKVTVNDPIGPYPEGIAELDEKLKAAPDDTQLWLERAKLLNSGLFMHEAIDAYSRALAIEPFNGEIYCLRGHRYMSVLAFAEAAADFVITTRLDPGSWDAWYHLGVSYYMLGHYAQAEKAMYRCYELLKTQDPRDYCAALDWRWRSLTRLGRKADADELLKCVPEGAECFEGDYGYMLNCSMYKGLVTPEQVYADPRVHSGSMDLMCVTYAVSNYYFCTGNIEKSNEFIDKCITGGQTQPRLTFGYMAALADKNARS